MSDLFKSRRELDRFWMERVRVVRNQYIHATILSGILSHGSDRDSRWLWALELENGALKEYSRVLGILRDLLVKGTVPAGSE